MNEATKAQAWILILLVVGVSACQVEQDEPQPPAVEETTPLPVEFLAGSYEVVGRYPDSEQLYSGTVEIHVSEAEANALSITRTIAEITTEGKGTLTTATGDAVPVLRVVFEQAGQTMEATYLVESDLDNYARLTGYVYQEAGGTSLPGIEVLFSNHYRGSDALQPPAHQ